MKVTSLVVVLVFIAFDVATGWLKAFSTGTTDSSIMRQGLFHKLAEIVAVLFGYICQYAFPYIGVEVKIPFASAIATYIVLMETASIVENLAIVNPNLANVLSKVFDKQKLNGGESDGKHVKDKSTDSIGSDTGKMG